MASTRFIQVFVPILAFLWLAQSAIADPLYVVRGSRGVITFTSRKPKTMDNSYVFAPKNGPRFSYYRSVGSRTYRVRARNTAYDEMIQKTALEHEVEPELVKAVVHVESAFNAQATSHKGAMGLMQLMPGTAKRFGVRNAYEPDQNVRGGVKYLKWLLDRYPGQLKLALAAYNAGELAVDRYKEVPPYSETQGYVRKVLSAVKAYRCKDVSKGNGSSSEGGTEQAKGEC